MAYRLTYQALVLDLYSAFYSARKHKSSKPYVRSFERKLRKNIESLAHDLFNHVYKPEPSSCFVIERPKKREVFAAQFRDRVVHHLYYNYTHVMFERTFIQDSYSCIPERGTHYGIERMAHHIRSESRNYQRKCYALQIDIRGYFMHIVRQRLADIATGEIKNMARHIAHDGKRWEDVLDIDFILWLTKEIVMLNPQTSCKIVGSREDWDGLEYSKSLFHTPAGCGLPIGNLTSQLFSNVYLNCFDQYMKRELKCRHYGRYVDDAYVISCDKQWLIGLIPKINTFLDERLGIELHMGKVRLIEVKYGVSFLGGFVKPFRTYISNACLRRMKDNISRINFRDPDAVYRSVNSYLGTLCHYRSYNIRSGLFLRNKFLKIAPFDRDVTKMMKPMN